MRIGIQLATRIGELDDVDSDQTVAHVLARLIAEGHLTPPESVPKGRLTVSIRRPPQQTGTEWSFGPEIDDLTRTLTDVGVRDGDRLLVLYEFVAGGADAIAALVAAGGAAKLAIEAARLRLDSYRAKTERMHAELEREQFEAQERRSEGSASTRDNS